MPSFVSSKNSGWDPRGDYDDTILVEYVMKSKKRTLEHSETDARR